MSVESQQSSKPLFIAGFLMATCTVSLALFTDSEANYWIRLAGLVASSLVSLSFLIVAIAIKLVRNR